MRTPEPLPAAPARATTPPSTTALPPLRRPGSLDAKRRLLVRNRRLATGFLGLATLAFVACVAVGRSTDAGWVGWARAAAEAAMVGGLADWFAVTALFRHPLGLPIPHTAIVPERKEQFGQTLGDFVTDSFLTPEVLAERVAGVHLGARASAWAAQPVNADRLARSFLEAAATGADLVDDEAVQRLIEDLLRDRLEHVPVAALAGRAVAAAVAEGRHRPFVDRALRVADRFLDDHRDDLRRQAEGKAPWWLPNAVEDRIFERLLEGGRLLLRDVADDPAHPLRAELDHRLAVWAHDLQTSPTMAERGHRLLQDALRGEASRSWAAAVWADVERSLGAAADDPAAPLRRRLADGIAAGAARVAGDPELIARVDDAAVAAARYAADHLGAEAASLITATIARWDAAETTSRLELLLGPDLQYIRINGTVVGGLAGLGLHAVAVALG